MVKGFINKINSYENVGTLTYGLGENSLRQFDGFLQRVLQ